MFSLLHCLPPSFSVLLKGDSFVSASAFTFASAFATVAAVESLNSSIVVVGRPFASLFAKS